MIRAVEDIICISNLMNSINHSDDMNEKMHGKDEMVAKVDDKINLKMGRCLCVMGVRIMA